MRGEVDIVEGLYRVCEGRQGQLALNEGARIWVSWGGVAVQGS